MTDHHMCPHCRKATLDVDLAMECRGDCPHCGGELIESLRVCIIPKCGKSLPVTQEMPVCRDCGIKIAVAHLHDATLIHAVSAEAKRIREAHLERVRNGQTKTACVYYVELAPNRIKIGFTSDLRQRLRNLRVQRGSLLAIEPGGRDLERERHQMFNADRIDSRREDFVHSGQITRHISALREVYDLPPWAKVPDTHAITRRQA